MQNETKVQAHWTALALLARQERQVRGEWRKYSRQANEFTCLRERAEAALRSTDPQIVSEAWAVIHEIDALRPDTAAIHENTATAITASFGLGAEASLFRRMSVSRSWRPGTHRA